MGVGERNIDVRQKHWLVASNTLHDWESNPLVVRMMLQLTKPPGQDREMIDR